MNRSKEINLLEKKISVVYETRTIKKVHATDNENFLLDKINDSVHILKEMNKEIIRLRIETKKLNNKNIELRKEIQHFKIHNVNYIGLIK